MEFSSGFVPVFNVKGPLILSNLMMSTTSSVFSILSSLLTAISSFTSAVPLSSCTLSVRSSKLAGLLGSVRRPQALLGKVPGLTLVDFALTVSCRVLSPQVLAHCLNFTTSSLRPFLVTGQGTCGIPSNNNNNYTFI